MEHLRRLLTDTYNERDVLTKELATARFEANLLTSRYQKWDRGFLLKRIRKESFAARKEAAETAAAKREELQEQLRLTTLATEIAVDQEQAEPYYRLRDEFAALSGCQKIWNVLAERAVDRIAERSRATTVINRELVSFSLDPCDLIAWENTPPHLRNLTGGDMYVYPGFILYRAAKQAFALIDFRDVTLTFVSTQFTETGIVPSDSQIVGQTWAKANKDGSPDRRFNGNHQIPIANYGTLLFTSPDGLDVRYVCSNPRLAEQFAKSWAAFRMSFGGQGSDCTEIAAQAQPSKAFDAARAFDASVTQFGKASTDFFDKVRTAGCEVIRGDFVVYAAAVMQFITAAKRYMEVPNEFQSQQGRTTFQRAIDSFEVAWGHFENCTCGDDKEFDNVIAYAKAQTVLTEAITQFMDVRTSGLKMEGRQLRRKLGE
jgi:hypothetical protein